MTLVDSSVWIDHLRVGHPGLSALLDDGRALVHPFVLGELACGTLKRRSDVLALLRRLPTAPVAADREVHVLLEHHGLAGRGLGWVDMHVLASWRLCGCELLTNDNALGRAARALS